MVAPLRPLEDVQPPGDAVLGGNLWRVNTG